MRIALFTDGIQPYVMGGMQKHSFFVAKYLARQGVHVDLYHFNQSDEHDINELAVFTEEEKKFIDSIVLEFPSKGNLPGHYLRESSEYSEEIFKIWQSREPVDFIFAKGFAAWHLLKEKKKGLSTPPVAVKFHGMNMFLKPPSFKTRLQNMMLRPATKFNMEEADHVFSYGGKVTDVIVDAGIRREKVIEVPTGVDAEWLTKEVTAKHDPIRFVFVGRYDLVKGIRELGEALESLSGQMPFEFNFIGPIPEENQLQIPEAVYWGKITEEKLMQEKLSECDVLVLTSYSEGMPNVILEAMARGLAILSTNVGAVSAMVKEQNGILIDECKVDLIKQGITRMAQLPNEDLLKMKQASRQIAEEELTWDRIASRLKSSIESAISNIATTK